MIGAKYTKEYQESLGFRILLKYNNAKPIIIVQDKKGYVEVYKIDPSNYIQSIDDAGDKYIKKLRKEKLEKLNEIQT